MPNILISNGLTLHIVLMVMVAVTGISSLFFSLQMKKRKVKQLSDYLKNSL